MGQYLKVKKHFLFKKESEKLLSEALDYLDFYTKNGYLGNIDFVNAADLCWRIKSFFQKIDTERR